MCAFHYSDFINTLKACDDYDIDDEISSEMAEYGLGMMYFRK